VFLKSRVQKERITEHTENTERTERTEQAVGEHLEVTEIDGGPDRLITTYLEMRSPEQFRPAFIERADIEVWPRRFDDVSAYRALYSAVGEAWNWRDRLLMADDQLAIALATADVSVLYVDGGVAGYVELADDGEGNSEIAYFGLLPAFFGQGLGKHLLSYAIRRAWDAGAKRVWLHTCNLDGPAALANYLARGFEVTRVEDEPMPARYK
jgi:GNAT superfamily N-acetyltransferase